MVSLDVELSPVFPLECVSFCRRIIVPALVVLKFVDAKAAERFVHGVVVSPHDVDKGAVVSTYIVPA